MTKKGKEKVRPTLPIEEKPHSKGELFLSSKK